MTTRRRLLQSLAAGTAIAALPARGEAAETGGVKPVPGRDPIDDVSQEYMTFRLGAAEAPLQDPLDFGVGFNWFDHLGSLAEMAMPESWRFTCPSLPPKNPDTPILEKYINYVFKKQVIDFNNYSYESNPEYADRIFYLRNEKACLTQASIQRTTRVSMDALPATNGKIRCLTGSSVVSLTTSHPI